MEDERQHNEMVHVLRSKDGWRGLKWQDGSYMRTTRHSAAVAECGCRLLDTSVARVSMRGLSLFFVHPVVRE